MNRNFSTEILSSQKITESRLYFFFSIVFLAYFLEYAIVRTLSVRPCVRESVDATTFHGVDRLRRFMARSIAYGPRTQTTEGIFFGPVLDPMGGVWSPNSVYFHINIVFYWYLRRVISLMWTGRVGDKSGRSQKVPPWYPLIDLYPVIGENTLLWK